MTLKVLVTGANGFIGSCLVEKLIEKGQDVRCLVRRTSNLKWINQCDIEIIYGDICRTESLLDAVRDVDEVYHVGGIVRAVKSATLYDVNTIGARNLVEAVIKCNPGIKRFVYVSSQAAWGPSGKGAVSHYGRSKYKAEEWAKKIETYSIVRPVAVYGPRDMDLLPIFRLAQKGVFLRPASGTGKLSFIHVDDCVDGIINACISEESFLSDGTDYRWQDIIEVLERVFVRKIRSVNLPRNLVRLMGAAGTLKGILTGHPAKLSYDKTREIFAGDWIVPGSSVKAKYGLESGFRATLDWYKKENLIK
ncbi:MAG: NAD-dependent epimerase/dehydratase family protein [Elusimicrobiota bacterium]